MIATSANAVINAKAATCGRWLDGTEDFVVQERIHLQTIEPASSQILRTTSAASGRWVVASECNVHP